MMLLERPSCSAVAHDSSPSARRKRSPLPWVPMTSRLPFTWIASRVDARNSVRGVCGVSSMPLAWAMGLCDTKGHARRERGWFWRRAARYKDLVMFFCCRSPTACSGPVHPRPKWTSRRTWTVASMPSSQPRFMLFCAPVRRDRRRPSRSAKLGTASLFVPCGIGSGATHGRSSGVRSLRALATSDLIAEAVQVLAKHPPDRASCQERPE